jgi:DNA mismatch endonuclease, patch repair protein
MSASRSHPREAELRGHYRPKSPNEIRRNMGAIRSTEAKTEVLLRRALFARGLRFRKNPKSVTGRPDICFPRERVAVFVDGDYWHGRLLLEQGIESVRNYYTAKQRAYWVPKLLRNVERDEYVTAILRDQGWIVIRIWESEVAKHLSAAVENIWRTIGNQRNLQSNAEQKSTKT